MSVMDNSAQDDVEQGTVVDVPQDEIEPRADSPTKSLRGNVQETHSGNIQGIHAALQEVQAELDDFLTQHLTKITSLREQIQIPTVIVTPAMEEKDPVVDDADQKGDRQSAGDNKSWNSNWATQRVRLSKESAVSNPPAVQNPLIDAHMQHIQQFLQAHMSNVHALQKSLGQPNNALITPKDEGVKRRGGTDSAGRRDALSQHFGMSVLSSTFAGVLILAFLSLVKFIIVANSSQHRTAFSFGMLFAFWALTTHFLNIFVAGRGAAISIASLRSGRQQEEANPADIDQYLSLSEQLQFIATLLFILPVAVLSFIAFTNLAFPLVFLIFSLVAAVVVFGSVYLKVDLSFGGLTSLLGNRRGRPSGNYTHSWGSR